MAGYFIEQKDIRTRQPQYPTRIDRSNPLAATLKALFYPLGGGQYEAVSGVLPTSDTGTFRAGVNGVLRDYVGGQKSTFANRAAFGLAGPMTLIVIADVDALSNYGALVSCQDTATTNGWELRLGTDASNSPILLHRANAGGFQQFSAFGSSLISAGTKANFIAVSCATNLVETAPTFNINGVAYTGSSIGGAGTGAAVASTSTLDIGARASGTTQLDGAVLFAALFDGALSFAQLERIRANPWQLIQPITRNTWVPVAAGGGGGFQAAWARNSNQIVQNNAKVSA